MKLLSALPFPVRLVLLALGGVVLFKFLSGHGFLLIVLSIVLWAFVLLGLFYAAGYLNAFSRVPLVSSALGFLTAQPAGAASPAAAGASGGQPVRSASAPPAAERELSDSEREKCLAEAEAIFESLIGIDDAVATIDQRLLEVARNTKVRGNKGFGFAAPALLVILAGPPGVGKTDSARAIAKLYAGAGILKTGKLITLRERDVKGGYGSSAGDGTLALAKEALDGALLLDDADWLVESDPTFNTTPGVDVGLAILDVAQEHPQRLLLLATMSAAAERKLRQDERHARWINRLTVRTITFDGLGDSDLLELLLRQLDRHGTTIDPEAETAAVNLIQDARKKTGEERFDNAEACRRLAEELVAAKLARLGTEGGGQEQVITRTDIRQVLDMM
jgi:ATPase family associated with various cellular activities (AAA)